MENVINTLEVAPFVPTCIFEESNEINKPQATMEFIRFLSKQYGFNIQYEWDNFVGKNPRARLATAQQKVEYYMTQAEDKLGMRRNLFLSKSRKREYVIVRQMLMYICYKNSLGSLKFIGSFFGHKDHATILHAIKTVRSLRDTKNVNFMPVYNSLKHLIEK